jgi:acetyl esterase/lipase
MQTPPYPRFMKLDMNIHPMIRSSFSILSAASICWIASSGSLFAQKQGGNALEPTKANVSYGPDERNVMDVWLAEGKGPRPVVVHYHSGGWCEGDKGRMSRDINPKQLLDAGISVVAVNYRLIPGKATSPATIDINTPPPVDAPLSDARRALQFVRLHAKEWNIDAQKVGVAGGSAGGCTSLWLAFHDDMADPKSDDPLLRQSTRVSCASVDWPQTTLDPVQGREWIPDLQYGAHAFGLTSIDDAIAKRDQIAPWIKKYSPAAWVSSDDPPVYLFFSKAPAMGQGGGDSTHSSNFGGGLKAICDQAKVPCELFYKGVEGAKHTSTTEYLIKTLTQ